MAKSAAFEVGDNATGDAHDVRWRRTKVVVPCSRCSPHFVVLQQVRVNEHTQLSCVAKGRHAAFGFGNSMFEGAQTIPHTLQQEFDAA